MKTKQHYLAPEVIYIKLDHEISLVLSSDNDTPPTYEFVNRGNSADYFDNNHLISNTSV